MNFGGSHYTAINRFYHAWQHVNLLRSCCEAEIDMHDGDTLHVLQEACSGFWWNLGSAVDNLGLALTDAPVTPRKDKGKEYFTLKYPQLNYVYDRRTQFIHSRIVPLTVDGGMVCFHGEHLSASRPELVAKYTDWDGAYTRQELAQDFYVQTWRSFLTEMGNAWWHLHSLLQTHDKDRPHLGSTQPQPARGSGCGTGFYGV